MNCKTCMRVRFHVCANRIITCVALAVHGCFAYYAPAEASCSHVVEVAQAQVEDHPQSSAVMREFAAIRLQDAEEGCHRLFRKYGLCAPVEVERTDLGPGPLSDFPFIRVSAWARYLLDTGRLTRQLCGIQSFEHLGLLCWSFGRGTDHYTQLTSSLAGVMLVWLT